MQFAGIVKECYETTVFPVPLNAIEHLINRCVKFCSSINSVVAIFYCLGTS